ncbi:MAG: hypothetical protein EOP22_11455 [Hyphomicrobiales bacterium]|nr:MAG: hypothetical protein EOP22_11455 [Hyphomicrobiales bacterium]
MDLLINGANLLYVATYFTTDMLRLSLMTSVAALWLALYFANQPEPLWNVVLWNLFFLGLNVIQVLRLILQRRRSCRLQVTR